MCFFATTKEKTGYRNRTMLRAINERKAGLPDEYWTEVRVTVAGKPVCIQFPYYIASLYILTCCFEHVCF